MKLNSSFSSGYTIRYSTSSKFKKNVRTKKASASTTKVTLKKIQKGKKYYVQVTPYTDVRNRVTGVTKKIDGCKSKVKKL